MNKTVYSGPVQEITVDVKAAQIIALTQKPWDYVFRWDDSVNEYFVRVLELDGCYSQGKTLEEGYSMIRDAMSLWFRVALEEGLPIPETNHDKLARSWDTRK